MAAEEENIPLLSLAKSQALHGAKFIIANRTNHDDLLNDRYENSRLYEYCVMYELDIFMHHDIPPYLFRNAPEALATHKLRDMGIDGLSGDFKTAVQAKFYSPGSTVCWTAISTFNTYCDALKTVERRIIATPENVKFNSLNKHLTNEHYIVSDEKFIEFYNLAKSFNDEECGISQLFKWQERAVLKLSSGLSKIDVKCADEQAKYIKLFAMCATGKTRVVAELITRGNYYPCIIFTHNQYLVNQMYTELKKWISPTISMTTIIDSRENANIYIAAYSQHKKVQQLIENVKGFKLCVIDEAHHVESTFKNVLSSTATIASKQIRNVINKERTLMLSADLKDLSGNNNFTYTFKDALEEKTIVDFNIIIFDGSNIAEFLKDDRGTTRIIAYCKSQDDEQNFSESLTKAGINHEFMTTKMNDSNKDSMVNSLKSGQIRVIIAPSTYTEGLNIPAANTCLFVGNISRTKIKQSIGRVLRKYPGKLSATVLFTHFEKAYVHELISIDDRLRGHRTVEDMLNSTNPRICHIKD